MLGEYAYKDAHEGCSYVFRDTYFFGLLRCTDGHEFFLAGDCVGAGGVFTFLIRGDVWNGHDFAYAAIASSGLALAATS